MICKDQWGNDINTDKVWGVYWYYPYLKGGSVYRKYKSRRRAEQAIGDFKKYYGDKHELFVVPIEYILPNHTCAPTPKEEIKTEKKIDWMNEWSKTSELLFSIVLVVILGLGIWKAIELII